jgi:hypothetical protein
MPPWCLPYVFVPRLVGQRPTFANRNDRREPSLNVPHRTYRFLDARTLPIVNPKPSSRRPPRDRGEKRAIGGASHLPPRRLPGDAVPVVERRSGARSHRQSLPGFVMAEAESTVHNARVLDLVRVPGKTLVCPRPQRVRWWASQPPRWGGLPQPSKHPPAISQRRRRSPAARHSRPRAPGARRTSG